MKRILTAALSVLIATGCGKNDGGGPAGPSETTLEISETKVSTGYLGNGVQFSMYEVNDSPQSDWGRAFNMWMDDAMWAKTLERLEYMKLGLVRTMISSAAYSFKGWDGNTNEPVIDLARGQERIDKWIGFCDRNDITVLWGEWGSANISDITDPVWSRVIIDYADYLINARGHTSIRYFIPVNEPDGGWTEVTGGNFNKWKAGAEAVYSRITEKNLQSRLQIAGPDACPGITGTSFIEKTASQLKDKIGIWNIHIYPYPDQIRSGSYEGLIRRWHDLMGRDKKLVIGEIGMKYKAGTSEYTENLRRALEDPMGKSDTGGGANMFVYDHFYAIDIADLYIQCMRGGMSGGCAWMVCDAMNTGPNQKMKRWGMWNIFGAKMGFPEDENIRPWFYPLSLLSRYIPRGSDILSVGDSGTDGVRAVASRCGGELTFAVVNNSDATRTVTVKKEGEAPRRMRIFTCSEHKRPVDAKQLPVPAEIRDVDLASGETIELPPLSFVLMSSLDY